MDPTAQPKIQRSRATRTERPAEEVRERRKKPGKTTQYGMKLHIDKDRLDPAYEHRWVNDKPGRVQQLHDEDWDPVKRLPAAEDEAAGTVPTKHVGFDEQGKPLKAVLMRKRKEWYDADQKEKAAPLDAMEQAIRKGTVHSNESDLKDVSYTPGGVNIIERS